MNSACQAPLLTRPSVYYIGLKAAGRQPDAAFQIMMPLVETEEHEHLHF